MALSDNPHDTVEADAAGLPAGMRKKRLIQVQNMLLQRRTWRYLRYEHTRRAFGMTTDVASVLVIGAGHGLAELALAIEYPSVNFLLTDWEGASHSMELVKRLKDEFGIGNIEFDTMNILEPKLPQKSFDMIISVEVLEHILDDARAARNMAAIARKHIFTLVPYSSSQDNANISARRKAFANHEHFRVGYDAAMLGTLFPGNGVTAGCYWKDAGLPFRERLNNMTDAEIVDHRTELARSARSDIRIKVPERGDALGIWRLAEPADLGF